jgi:hypothetical protein
MLYVVLPPSHNIRHSRCGHEVLRRSEKVGCIENEEERGVGIEMYWEERNMHCEVRMTCILGKLEMAKVT